MLRPGHYPSCPDDCRFEHQPRERETTCTRCGTGTTEVSAVCGRCISVGEHPSSDPQAVA